MQATFAPEVVSKESLHALANVALVAIAPNAPEKPEWNMQDTVSEALLRVLDGRFNARGENEASNAKARYYRNGYVDGVELGLNIASAIINSGLNAKMTRDSISAEIESSSKSWPFDCVTPEADGNA